MKLHYNNFLNLLPTDYFSLEGHKASIKSTLWVNEFMIISGSEDKTIR